MKHSMKDTQLSFVTSVLHEISADKQEDSFCQSRLQIQSDICRLWWVPQGTEAELPFLLWRGPSCTDWLIT